MADIRSVLVTGGAGFIGSHTCKALAEAGWRPVVVDNLTTGHRENVRWGPFVEADVRDRASLQAAMRAHEVDAVLHFAASAYVGESMARPDLYYDNNVRGILALLDACASTGVHRFVFSSSCATYGLPDTLPITEDTRQRPINPYGRTKLMGEEILRDYGGQHGIDHVILRYFNAAGADPDGALEERHEPETHLIPLALQAAFGERRLKVFGEDYDTPDGTCIRDYIHVSDLAQGHVAAVNRLFPGSRSGASLAVNLGTGHGYSIREILSAIESELGRPVPHEIAPRRPGDPGALVADPTRAREALGFSPVYSDLKTIVRTAAARYASEEANVAVG